MGSAASAASIATSSRFTASSFVRLRPAMAQRTVFGRVAREVLGDELPREARRAEEDDVVFASGHWYLWAARSRMLAT